MKNTILLLFIALTAYTAHSQVLYNENFDNLTLGNLDTDPTGVTPGQGGWLTTMAQNAYNSHVTIAAEPNKSKVLSVSIGMLLPHHNKAVVNNRFKCINRPAYPLQQCY